MSAHRRACRHLFTASLLFAVSIGFVTAGQAQQINKNVIVSTPQPYTNVIAAIQQMGGTVTAQYKYVGALAVTIPSSSLSNLRDLVGEDAMTEDSAVTIQSPPHSDHSNVNKTNSGIYVSATVGSGTRIFDSSAGLPNPALPESSYAVNLQNLDVNQLHSTGITGKGMTIAVIDSGVRPGYFALDSDGSVIGGENFVPDGGSYSSMSNDPHGTFAATLISGNASFVVPQDASADFISSMNANFLYTLQSSQGSVFLPLFGSAPESSIYVVRVFGTGPFAAAPKSRIMTAIESVIDLRNKFDQGLPGGVNIKVCNLSFGTSTIYAGHTPLEQLIDQLFANDIVPIIAAGDAGPSSLTISSPATAFSALTVGATSPAANERLWRAMSGDSNAQAALARPSSATQTAFFSSRGPTADGRTLPDVVVAGLGVMSQGCGDDDGTGTCPFTPNSIFTIDVASGTSFSAPIVSGVAALLRQKFPNASAGQIWNAIVNGANPSELGDGSTSLDQGQGVVNASASATLLQKGNVSDQLPKPTNANLSVANNIQRNTELNVSHGTVKQAFQNLKPGQRGEILYEVQDQTIALTIDISNIVATAQQNIRFGDDILFQVHTAKTSAGPFGDYFGFAYLVPNGQYEFVIPDPEPGIVRITLLGDETNAGAISANVVVTTTMNPVPKISVTDSIRGGDNLFYPFTMPAGVQQAEFLLSWNSNWDQYPTDDLDMYLFDPLLNIDADGATLNSPEHAVVLNPAPGIWTVLLQGFAVATKKDQFQLSVILDGKVVKLN